MALAAQEEVERSAAVDRASAVTALERLVLKNARTLRRLCLLAVEANTEQVRRIGGPVIVSDLGEFTLVKIAALVEVECLCRYLREWIDHKKSHVLATVHRIH